MLRPSPPLHVLLDRRGFLSLLPSGLFAAGLHRPPGAAAPARLAFEPIPLSTDDAVHVPAGYRAQVLLRWGDPLFPDAPPFDLAHQSPDRQARQFGFNCDFNGFFPLTAGSPGHGLLCVNHEYTFRTEMFPGADRAHPRPGEVEIELEAMGMSVVEVRRGQDGSFRVEQGSHYNRRITGTTPMDFVGAAAGHALLRTEADPAGVRVLGMLNNCAGGKTPWGTVLTCEENFPGYFGRTAGVGDARDQQAFRAYGFAALTSYFGWEETVERFDAQRHPNETNRFGWVVEIDPFDPASTPRKLTGLGRARHECATTGLSPDGRVVVYSGDDTYDEFIYKFVSAGRFDPLNRAANLGLLERGTLYAARLESDGTGTWLPLVPEGPLAGWSQGEILVRTRMAAALLGATPMDRPEDIEIHPDSGHVFVAMTKNPARTAGDGGPNPRAANRAGHVLELIENHGNQAATNFTWLPFLLCGDPAAQGDTYYGLGDPDELSPLACPDNLAFDPQGRLWIATDGQREVLAGNDGLYAVATAGPERGETRRFLSGPVRAEICGPEFTPDGRTLFLNIQHPGEGGGLASPASHWPDGGDAPPRPSLLAIHREDGGPIGS